MSDNDQTILSSRGDNGGPERPKRNWLLIGGGIVLTLLICAGLVFSGGFLMVGDNSDQVSGEDETIAAETDSTPNPTPGSTPLLEATEEAASPTPEATEETVESTTEPSPEPSPTLTPVQNGPEITSITFALGATEDREPIEPSDRFAGEVLQIHALFEYESFSPDDIWERVWLLDGEEMFRTDEAWVGEATGVFDYFINAGGEPLSVGEWTLELYVNDQLLASESFEIVEADALAEANPTAEADEAGEAEPSVETSQEQAEAVDNEDETEATPDPAQVEIEASDSDEQSEHDADLPPAEATEVTAAPTAEPLAPMQTYQLAYTKWDGGSHNLHIGDTSGSFEQFVLGRAVGPSWEPNGNRVFFFGASGANRQEVEGVEYLFAEISDGIVAVDALPIPTNMSEVQLFQQLDWKNGRARTTAVSPNGELVAFDALDGSGNYRIFFVGVEDQELEFEIIGEQPAWSPDSQQLVYRSGRDGRTGIWISNRNDTGHQLITSGASDSFPSWSPDGQTIVFSRDEGGNVDIYTVNVDGSNLQRLTNAPGPDTLPAFTPDGDIVFRSTRTGVWGIWKMRADGSTQTEIIPNAPVGPDWAGSKMSVLGS